MSTGGPAAVAIERVAETASTNADLLAWARTAPEAGPPAPRALVAERQTAGRGRLGRRWQATPGASLTFSLAWPFLPGTSPAGLSLAVGVALAEALDPRPAAPLRIGLKWPNDLWLVGPAEPGRKLAGVLIETVSRDSAWIAVIGVGLNLHEQPVATASTGVAWLAEVDAAAAAGPEALSERLVATLAAALRRFEAGGFAACADAFARRDLLRGRAVRCEAGADVREGVAAGVAATGELLLRTPSGIATIASGEVSVRLGPETAVAAGPRPSASASC